MKRLACWWFVFAIGFSQAGDRAERNLQDDAKAKAAKAQVNLLSKAVDVFALKNKGEYPAKLEDLLTTKPAILESKAALIDPWKKPYMYDASGPKNSGVRPDIWTVTPAKETIGNWPDKPQDTYESLEFEVKVKEAQALVAAATKAVEAYALLKGAFPDTLEEMLKEGKINGPLLDPWKRPIQYDRKGPKNKGIRPDRKRPDVWTERPDTKELIGNWQALEGDPKKAIYDAQVKLARFNLATLSTAVKAYYSKNNRFPDGLYQLLEGKPPFVDEREYWDPWRNPYKYNSNGALNEGKMPDIWTVTPSKETIGNWPNVVLRLAASTQFKSKTQEAYARIVVLDKALDAFARKSGAFPDKLEQLLESKMPYVTKGALIDPWGEKFSYDKSGRQHAGKRPDIWTYSADLKVIANSKDIDAEVQHIIKVECARVSLAILSSAVKAYHVKNNRFPDSLNELTEGKPPFVPEKARLFDPWGNQFQYNREGPYNEGKLPDIWTESPMWEHIGNWQKEEKKK